MNGFYIKWNTCLVDGAPTLSCVPHVIQVIINWLIVLAGIIALFLVIYSGIKFINSGGDPKSVDSAKKALTYALLGFIVILLSFFIVNFIATFTGVESLRRIKLGV